MIQTILDKTTRARYAMRALTAQVVEPTLSLQSPTALQMFQRSGANGQIVIRGTITGSDAIHMIEAQLNGGSWQIVANDANNPAKVFEGTLTAPIGQHTLNVRVFGATTITTVPNVTIGDVFVLDGQSNMYGAALINVYCQPVNMPTLITPGYVQNVGWFDHKTRPEYRRGYSPYIAQRIIESEGVPVGLIQTAEPSTAIAEHLPGTPLFERTLLRACNAGAAYAGLLMHIGESDVGLRTPRVVFKRQLIEYAEAIHDYLNVQLYICQIQQVLPATNAWHEINAGIVEACNESPYLTLAADLRDLKPDDNRAHLRIEPNISTAAERWWQGLRGALYA